MNRSAYCVWFQLGPSVRSLKYPANSASKLASAFNTAADGFVSATSSGNSVIVFNLTDGPATGMSITDEVSDSNPTTSPQPASR